MIGRVRGTLVERRPEAVIVDVGGVGYEIAVTTRDLASLPPIGDEIVLHTHLHVREDQLALFGFSTADERELFRTLIGVSGVGPRVALAILSTLSDGELRRAVVTEDVATLTLVPGIGKRSAQKIMLELRPRLELPDAELPGESSLAEVRNALESLGYRDEEIRPVVAQLPDGMTVDEALRTCLQRLGSER